jgi:hypothetical protein
MIPKDKIMSQILSGLEKRIGSDEPKEPSEFKIVAEDLIEAINSKSVDDLEKCLQAFADIIQAKDIEQDEMMEKEEE